MKVLQSGNQPAPWKMQVTCTGREMQYYNHHPKGCGAVLEIEREDIYFASGGYQEVEDSSYMAILCPECKSLTKLAEDEKPQYPYAGGFTYKPVQEAIAYQKAYVAARKKGLMPTRPDDN